MSSRCPDGHTSESSDYCDVCGQPIESAAPVPSRVQAGQVPAAPSSAPGPAASPGLLDLGTADKSCPSCGTLVPISDLFCEVCGYDFTTGVMPEAAGNPGPDDGFLVPTMPHQTTTTPPGDPVQPSNSPIWVAEVWIDPDWYATQESDDPCPSAGMPVVVLLEDQSILVGRRSTSRNIHPQVDCGADHGVSRRHAQLTTDGRRWFAEDLRSSNGTYISPAGAPLPSDPIPPGQRTEFREGDRVYVGAWTRIVVRRATSDD